MGFLHIPKELNGLSEWVLSHWFTTGRSSHAGATRRPDSEGGVGGAGPSRTHMWFCLGRVCLCHPKHRNINLPNITHSLISRNPKERMFIAQISLVIVTFLSLISQILSLTHTTKEGNPHPRIAPCVNMWSVTFLYILILPLLLLMPLVECWCVHMSHHPGRPSGVDHTSGGERMNSNSIVSHATLILRYHTSMSTLQTP